MSDRRPRRLCAERRTAVPSAVHYLGYVEDEETPEMIMRKFEELEKVMAAARVNQLPKHGQKSPQLGQEARTGHPSGSGSGSAAAEPYSQAQHAADHPQSSIPAAKLDQQQHDNQGDALDDALLLKVLRRTRNLNSHGGQSSRFADADPGDTSLSEENDASESEQGLGIPQSFWSDQEQDTLAAGSSKPKVKRKRQKTTSGVKRTGSREGHVSQRRYLGMPTRERNILSQVLMQTNRDSYALIRRKAPTEVQPRDDIFQLRIPLPPLPTAWGRTVRPWDPARSLSLSAVCRQPLPTIPAAVPLPGCGQGLDLRLAPPPPFSCHQQHFMDMLSPELGQCPDFQLAPPSLCGQQQQQLVAMPMPGTEQSPALHPAAPHPSFHRPPQHPRAMFLPTSELDTAFHMAPPPPPFRSQPHHHMAVYSSEQQHPMSIYQHAATTTLVPVAEQQSLSECEPPSVLQLLMCDMPCDSPMPVPTPDKSLLQATSSGLAGLQGMGLRMDLHTTQQVGGGAGEEHLSAALDWLAAKQGGPAPDLPPGLALGAPAVPLPLPTWQQQQQHMPSEQQQRHQPDCAVPPPPSKQRQTHSLQQHQSAPIQQHIQQQQPCAHVPCPTAPLDQQLQQGYLETHSISDLDLPALFGRTFNVVMVNIGWEVVGCDDDDMQLLSRVSKLAMPRLCPYGFVFVWAHKQHIQATCKQLYSWGYTYIENLTWVWLQPNNTIARLPSQQPLARSHLTLLMFRKEGEGKDIQLRHQRNADVVLDCVRHTEGCAHAPPPEVYATLETMLPGEVTAGRCLELWAERGSTRPGWMRVVEVPS